MTDELDLLRGYMESAYAPTSIEIDACRRDLEAVIAREDTAELSTHERQNTAILTLRFPGHTPHRHRMPRFVTVATVAAVLIGAVVLILTGTSPHRSATSQHGPSDLSWRLVSSTTSPFRSLAPGGQTNLECVTDDICYSPGAGTTELFRTINGGQSWQPTTPIPLKLQGPGFQFSCSSPGTCAVIGTASGQSSGPLADMAFTTDGGVKWSTSSIPMPSGIPNASPGRFVCGDSSHCLLSVVGSVAQGTPGQGANPTQVGTFLSTSDGGRTWSQATSVPSAAAASVWTLNCTSNGACIAVSAMGENPHSWIVGLSSHDWGMTWVAGPPAVYNDAAILYASCGDATHCMLVPLAGPSNAPYEIATTSDGGLTWQVSAPPTGWLNMPTAVSCATGVDCWIAMSNYDERNPAGAYSDPVIEVTHNGGNTWSSIPLPTNKPPISDVLTLSCPPSGDGCMGIGNLQDHFVLPTRTSDKPQPLSGPLVISNLPPGE